MQIATGQTVCLAADEVSQTGGPLLHACSLRFTYARMEKYGLDPANYMSSPRDWFGQTFMILFLGDFMQLPSVPDTHSLLHTSSLASFEHQQARFLAEHVELAYDFVISKRFSDPLLVEILKVMRCGGTMSHQAWKALSQTQVRAKDERLIHAGGYYECAYTWDIVSLAQQLRPRLSAHNSGEVLVYVQAVDKPSRRCSKEEHLAMLQTSSLSTTKKLMGLLPVHRNMLVRLTKLIAAPELVPERALLATPLLFHLCYLDCVLAAMSCFSSKSKVRESFLASNFVFRMIRATGPLVAPLAFLSSSASEKIRSCQQ